MVYRFVRRTLAVVTLVVPAALAACSAQSPEESAAQSDQALLKCKPGYVAVCDTLEGPRGPTVSCTCQPSQLGFYSISSASPDACDPTPVPVPSGLANRGCKTGVMVNHQPVWACPTGTPLPHSLGYVHAPDGGSRTICSFDTRPFPTNVPCEVVEGFTQSSDPCIGSAASGWMFILDTEWIPQIWPGNSGCPGQCAEPVPPGEKVGFTHG